MCRKGINITEYTFSKRYDDIRSLILYIRGFTYYAHSLPKRALI